MTRRNALSRTVECTPAVDGEEPLFMPLEWAEQYARYLSQHTNKPHAVIRRGDGYRVLPCVAVADVAAEHRRAHVVHQILVGIDHVRADLDDDDTRPVTLASLVERLR